MKKDKFVLIAGEIILLFLASSWPIFAQNFNGGKYLLLNLGTSIFAYILFFRVTKNFQITFICTALYTLSVYRIIQIYILNQYSNVIVMMLLPIIMIAAYEVIVSKSRQVMWCGLSIFCIGIIYYVDVIRGMLTVFFISIFLIFNFKNFVKINVWHWFAMEILGGMLIGSYRMLQLANAIKTQLMEGISGTLIQINGTNLARLTTHFWLPQNYGDDVIVGIRPEGVGILLLCFLAEVFWKWFCGKYKDDIHSRLIKSFAVFILVIVVMSMNIFPWDYIEMISPVFRAIIGYMETPTVCLSYATLCLITIGAIEISKIEYKSLKYNVIVALCVVSIFTSNIYLLNYVM